MQPPEGKYLDRWHTCQAPIQVFETWFVRDSDCNGLSQAPGSLRFVRLAGLKRARFGYFSLRSVVVIFRER